MTSDEGQAKAWLKAELNVSRETQDQLSCFVEMVGSESKRQNLVAASTLPAMWMRHVVDSAQLVRLAPPAASSWCDLGSGAGFPGIVVGLLFPGRVTLVESRRLRADFLSRVVEQLALHNTTILHADVRTARADAHDVVSARAFASLVRTLELGRRLASPEATWLLPKGQRAKLELEEASGSWQGSFRIEPSVTDPDSGIIVAEQVRPMSSRRRTR